MRNRLLIPLTLLTIVVSLYGPPVCGQSAQLSPAVDESPAPHIEVFSLRFAAASEIGELVQALIGESTTRLVTDERTNSLVVTSPSESDLEMIEALLMRLDQGAETTNAVQTQLVPLKTNPDAALLDALDTVAGQVRYTVDPARQLVVVRGTQEDVKQVTELLTALETLDAQRAKPVPALKSATLRIAWLMNGLETPGAKPVPAPMNDAVATLSKVGITDLQLVTQLLVNVQASNSPFETQGTLELPEPVAISVSGVMEQDGIIELEVSTEGIQRMVRGGQGQQPASPSYQTELRASVMLRPGQLAVLGATPCGTHDSVFVVELIP